MLVYKSSIHSEHAAFIHMFTLPEVYRDYCDLCSFVFHANNPGYKVAICALCDDYLCKLQLIPVTYFMEGIDAEEEDI